MLRLILLALSLASPYPFARVDDDLPRQTHRGHDGHLIYTRPDGREVLD